MMSLKTISVAVACEKAHFPASRAMPDGGEYPRERISCLPVIPVLCAESHRRPAGRCSP